MTTTPTRQDVLDALLAERIGRLSETVRVSIEGCLDMAALDEMDATGKDYGEAYDLMIEHYESGLEVLQSWRLVQSEVFDKSEPPSIVSMTKYFFAQGLRGKLLEVYGGYIPTSQHTRYVGLAPRQEEES